MLCCFLCHHDWPSVRLRWVRVPWQKKRVRRPVCYGCLLYKL